MSAFDIAGAVIWTPCSALLWLWAALAIRAAKLQGRSLDGEEMGGATVVIIVALPTGLAAVFCIARLLGAHL